MAEDRNKYIFYCCIYRINPVRAMLVELHMGERAFEQKHGSLDIENSIRINSGEIR
jgi:hypothetical protein